MTQSILASVAHDASLLRWLHSHDPDRNITPDILHVSATYTSFVVPPRPDAAATAAAPASEPAAAPPPPVSSLFVPMYNRSHFVLGQLYGPMSPNAMALNLLAQAGYGHAPDPISRRFVVDLSFRDSLQFIEYEWFSDGKLCVSIHTISSRGRYSGKSTLMAPPATAPAPSTPLQKHHLVEGVTQRPHTSREIMTLWFTQNSQACAACAAADGSCNCALPEGSSGPPEQPFEAPTDWMSWLAAFGRSRMGLADMTVRFSMATPAGPMSDERKVRLHQTCELGVSQSHSQGNLLARMFMDSAGMLVSHPNTDNLVLAAEEKRDRIELANQLSEEDDTWVSPRVFSLDTSDAGPQPVIEMLTDGTYESPLESAHRASDGWSLGHASNGIPNDVLPQRCAQETQHTYGATNGAVYSIGVSAPSATRYPTQWRQDAGLDRTPRVQKVSRVTKRKGKQGDKLFACECGKVFTHKGHYNEHRLCVHEKVRQHRCLFVNCQSRFFKKSDRDRHMRSKHDSSRVLCSVCEAVFADKDSLDLHSENEHPSKGKFACANCALSYNTQDGLRLHMPNCRTAS